MSRIGTSGQGQSNYYGSLGSILEGFFTGEVAQGLNVTAQSSPNMTVQVQPGIAAIPDGSGATKDKYLVRLDTTGGEQVTISTASGSNPRRTLIVAYFDSTVVVNPNNPGALKFVAVDGTPNSSPTDPSGATILTATGSKPYIILARVLVGTSVTTITSGNITDLRTMAVGVPDGGVTKPKLGPDSVDGSKVDWAATGADGGIWWEELGRTKLSSAANNMNVSIASRKFLRVIIFIAGSTEATVPRIGFNNDAAGNYSSRRVENSGAEAAAVSSARIALHTSAWPHADYAALDVINFVGRNKGVIGQVNSIPSSAGAAPTRIEVAGTWANSGANISSVQVITDTNNFNADSEVVVLGHD